MQVFSSIVQKVGLYKKHLSNNETHVLLFLENLNIFDVISIGRHLYTLIISKTIY